MKKDSFCNYCGSEFPSNAIYPKKCNNCQNIVYSNPIPVCVMLVPYLGKVLGVRRGIEPHKGKLALPGGFVDGGESWQKAGAREVWEELQVVIDPGKIDLFSVNSTEDNRLVLIFGVYRYLVQEDIKEFIISEEAQERVWMGPSETLAFPLHDLIFKNFYQKELSPK